MFEQSYFNIEEPQKPETTSPESAANGDAELFNNYEITNWDYSKSKRILSILGISAVFNLLLIFGAAQTPILSMKGCDSPLVGQVCQVLDAVYVGSKLLGTDREWVDAAYEKTDLGDMDVTWVDVTGADSNAPLSYPEGYFQIANPEEWAMKQQMLAQQQNQNIEGFPSFPSAGSGFPPVSVTPPPTKNNFPRPKSGSSIFDTKPKVAKQNPNALQGFGDDDTQASNTKKPSDKANAKNGKNKADDGMEEIAPGIKVPKKDKGQPSLDSPPENSINTRPLDEYANRVNDILKDPNFRLETQFIVNASAKLTKDGKLDSKSFRWGQVKVENNDKKMMEVVRGAIQALSDSGVLNTLQDISGKDLDLTLSQDQQAISADIFSRLASKEEADSVASGLRLGLQVKLSGLGEGADQNDRDLVALLKGATITSEGNQLKIKFSMPKDIALPMIQRKLAERKQKQDLEKQNRPSNGNSLGNAVRHTDDNVAKR